MRAYVDIVLPDGSSERHPLDEPQVYLGRAPRSGVALPEAVDLEAEHLVLSARPEGCWVGVADGVRVGVTLGGAPFRAGIVPWGGELQVGRLRLVVGREADAAREPLVSLPVILAVVVILPLAGWLLLSGGEREAITTKKVAPPELFPEAEACPEKGPAAAALAREIAEAAAAKAERYPFAPRDGLEAVALYGRAARCFGDASEAAEAARLEQLRATWRAKVAEDFNTTRLRLERSLKERAHVDALQQTHVLLAYLEGRADPYTSWLLQLRRHLDLKLAQAPKRRGR